MSGNAPGEAVERLTRLAEDHFGAPVTETAPLPGDASDRTYIRLRHPGGGAPSSVGMILGAPFTGRELPFINVQTHFSEIGIPVPGIYAADSTAGVLLLEDGGNRSLETVWNIEKWKGAQPFYEKSIDLLAALQNAPREEKGRLALSYGFDAALFTRELNMTRRYAFAALCGMSAPEADFDAPFANLAKELCALPYALTHRDYHSRNLLAGDAGGLLVLDFQDARLGPLTYDLAALAYDSYVPLPEEGRASLIEKFWEAAGRSHFKDRPAFDRALTLTALQRNLKAIGTFAHQKTERGNPRYIRYISPAAGHVRRHLDALPGLSDFAARLEPYLDALGTLEKEKVH